MLSCLNLVVSSWRRRGRIWQQHKSEFINSRYNTCASRAYYACFLAAIYALAQNGIGPLRGDGQWGHDFVQGEFNRLLINQRKLYPSALRTTLDQNRTLRRVADYTTDRVSEVRADRAVARAERFLEAISPGGGEAT